MTDLRRISQPHELNDARRDSKAWELLAEAEEVYRRRNSATGSLINYIVDRESIVSLDHYFTFLFRRSLAEATEDFHSSLKLINELGAELDESAIGQPILIDATSVPAIVGVIDSHEGETKNPVRFIINKPSKTGTRSGRIELAVRLLKESDDFSIGRPRRNEPFFGNEVQAIITSDLTISPSPIDSGAEGQTENFPNTKLWIGEDKIKLWASRRSMSGGEEYIAPLFEAIAAESSK